MSTPALAPSVPAPENSAVRQVTARAAAEDRIVIVLADDVPGGPAVNAGVLLGITLGRMFPDVVGVDVTDASGTVHPGISALNVPVLRTDRPGLVALAARARAAAPGEVTVVDFTETARRARNYQDYAARVGDRATEELAPIALALHGPRATITSLTGQLPLHR